MRRELDFFFFPSSSSILGDLRVWKSKAQDHTNVTTKKGAFPGLRDTTKSIQSGRPEAACSAAMAALVSMNEVGIEVVTEQTPRPLLALQTPALL